MMHAIAVILLLALMVSTNAFVSTPSPLKHISQSLKPSRKMELQMGGKMSKFGIFSPAVYAAKLVLGEKKLEKVRGKAISLHSQAITEWCLFYGAYNLRLKLIKTAKKNGDTLGFLV